MTDIAIANTVECVIFVVSLMLWGGFLVFICAAYIVCKKDNELDELKSINSIREARLDKMVMEQRELRTELYRQQVDADRIISMFRDVKYTIGYKPNTPMGRIARAARLHWFQISAMKGGR